MGVDASASGIRPVTRPALSPAFAPAYRLLAAVAVMTAVLFAVYGFRLVGHEFSLFAGLDGLTLAVAWSLRAHGWEWLATPLEGWALWTATCVLMVLATYGVTADAMPLIDPTLARADALLAPWFDWPATVRALADHSVLMTLAYRAYASLDWQPLLLFAGCCAFRRSDRCWQFLTAWIATLVFVVAIVAIFPAVGAYPHYALAAAELPMVRDPAPWATPGVVADLRDGMLRDITFLRMEGIVTAPSFHAAGAVLLAWGFWPLRLLRWPMALLNGAMLLSAVPIGGHYLIDLPAGVAVAVAGITMARRIGPMTGLAIECRPAP